MGWAWKELIYPGILWRVIYSIKGISYETDEMPDMRKRNKQFCSLRQRATRNLLGSLSYLQIS